MNHRPIKRGVGADEALCPFEDHRSTDWRLKPAGKWHCGKCHPPAASIPTELIERRSAPIAVADE